jgi:hypothetical protein
MVSVHTVNTNGSRRVKRQLYAFRTTTATTGSRGGEEGVMREHLVMLVRLMQTAVVAPAVAVSSKSASLQWCHLSRLNLYVTLRKKLVTLTCAEGNCNVNVLN